MRGWKCGRTVAHDQGSLLVDGLLRDGWAQVVGQEDGLVLRGGLQTEMLLAGSVEVAQEQADIVPSPVSELFRVPGVGGVSSTRPDGRRQTQGRGVRLRPRLG